MNSRPEYPQGRHQSLLLNIPGKNNAVQIFRVRNVDLGRKHDAVQTARGDLRPNSRRRSTARKLRCAETGYYLAICRSQHAAFRNRHIPAGSVARHFGSRQLASTRRRETMTITSPDARERMIVTASLTSGIAC